MNSHQLPLRPLLIGGAIGAGGFLAAFAIVLAIPGDDTDPPGADPAPTHTPTLMPEATPTATPSPTPPPPTPTLTPLPAPATPEGWDEFQSSLEAAVLSYGVPGRYAFAVTDLQTGLTASVNGEQHQLTGCIVNLFVIVSALQDVERGLYERHVVDDLIASTIWSSNAASAYELYGITGSGDPALGVQKVQSLFDALGLAETQIDHPPAYSGDGELAFPVPPGGASAQAVPDDSNNWTTAHDMNRALAALYGSKLLGPAATEDLLERLTHVKAGLNYLVAAVPGDAAVSHKNGFFPNTDGTWVDNDIGIVRFERGGATYAYAVSFLSDSVPDKYGDIPLGQQLSALAYHYFTAAYGVEE